MAERGDQSNVRGFTTTPEGKVVDNRVERVGVLRPKDWAMIALGAAAVGGAALGGMAHPEIPVMFAKIAGLSGATENFVWAGSALAGFLDLVVTGATIYIGHEFSRTREEQGKNTNQED